MAGSNRHLVLATIALPFLFLVMTGLARATVITVTTLADPTGAIGTCSLRDAITAANTKTATNNCTAGTGTDTIVFTVSGAITLGSNLPAIANTSPGSLTIDGSGQAVTVDGAGSFRTITVNSGATLALHDLTVAHGFSIGGGGIFNSGTLRVTDSTFSGNNASNGGGGILNNGMLAVTSSTFLGNHAGNFGGGIENLSGTVTVTNCTFSDNNAGHGGGILNLNANTLTITNSTFSGNSANPGGGGIDNDGIATLKGTILAAESSGGNCGGTTAVTDAGYNISDDNSCGFSGTSVNDSTTLHLDPAGLANNGGPTQTIALEPNSEAVDFIPVASCTDQSSPTPLVLTTDQRGLPRPDPGNPNFCDAGAFELQTTPFVIAPNSERLQIARSTIPDSDHINTAFTFTENGFPACDAADNAFNGFFLVLESGTCAVHDHTALLFFLNPWVVHTVNHQSYGTLFSSFPPGSLSARMVELPTPAAPACGEWSLNLEIAGIDSTPLGNGPFSLILSNTDGDTECFDITNAIVGSQTPPPPHGVRRRVRR